MVHGSILFSLSLSSTHAFLLSFGTSEIRLNTHLSHCSAEVVIATAFPYYSTMAVSLLEPFLQVPVNNLFRRY